MPGSGGGWRRRWRVVGGLLPVGRSEVTGDVLAGLTLAAVGIPEVLGYAKIAGMPVVTGLYTMLLPMAVFAVLGSSRHLVVGRGLRHRGDPRRRARRARGGGVAAVRPVGRAGGPAGRGDAAAGPAGPARVPGEFPVPHRPGRLPHRRRYPGGRRSAPGHARGSRRGQQHPGQAPGHGARASGRSPRQTVAVSVAVILVVLAARRVSPQGPRGR